MKVYVVLTTPDVGESADDVAERLAKLIKDYACFPVSAFEVLSAEEMFE